jgi:hypothetical protein
LFFRKKGKTTWEVGIERGPRDGVAEEERVWEMGGMRWMTHVILAVGFE